MPGRNTNNPAGSKHTGWYRDGANNRLEIFFNGTKVGHVNASGMSITDDTTARMTNGVLQPAGAASQLKNYTVRLGTTAAIASNGADAILADAMWVVPTIYANGVTIVEAYKMNISASDVTKGTATSSASFRRYNLITNTAGTGTGTNIVASLNATASAASLVTRSFTTVASTVPAGAIVLLSHLTVGAQTADGTDGAAGIIELAYQVV